MTQLERRQKERESLLTAIAAAEAWQSVVTDRRIVEQALLAQVDQWRGFLTEEPDVAGTCQFLRELLEGPLTFTSVPHQKAYRFEGQASPERLFGQVGLPPCVASRTGFEPYRVRIPCWFRPHNEVPIQVFADLARTWEDW